MAVYNDKIIILMTVCFNEKKLFLKRSFSFNFRKPEG